MHVDFCGQDAAETHSELNIDIAVGDRTRILYRTRMVHTIRVRYVPYAYGMFFCTIRVWLYRTRIYVSHSIKLSTWTGGSTYTQKVYYSSQGYQNRSNSL